ncbi:MAG TPA: lytic murein transglycosylase [Elusimicrobiota bacterium]|nr:lytic murein transglycosylase [Elusimicrobiota bacterium]
MRRAIFLAVTAISPALPAFAAPAPVSDQAFFLQLARLQSIAQTPGLFSAQSRQPLLDKAAVENKVLPMLAGTGVPAEFARAAIEDPKTAAIPIIIRLLSAPAESLPYWRYRKLFITPGNIARGTQFYRDHKDILGQVRARYGADPLVLVSLVGIETRWGGNTGSFHVLSALFTIAAAFPSLSNWACNEIAQYLEICWKGSVDPQSVLGSYAGAFGYYQFMPSSYNAYAVDFDGDGKKSWDQWPDVLASVANYLTAHGYKPGPDQSQGSPVWNALYAYNHSDNYVRVILEMRQDIRAQLGPDAP